MNRIVNTLIVSLWIAVFSAMSPTYAQELFLPKRSLQEIEQTRQEAASKARNDADARQEFDNYMEVQSLELQKKENLSDKERETISRYEKLPSAKKEALKKKSDDYGRQLLTEETVAKRDATYVAPSYHARINTDPCMGENKCKPYCYYKDMVSGDGKYKSCTFCSLLEIAFNTSSKMAQHSINTFSGSVIKVVIIAFAIWLAITILNFTATLETRDLKDLAQNVIKQAFMVMLAVFILQGGAMSFMNMALSPVFQTGMNIAEATISPKSVNLNTKNDDIRVSCPETGIYDDRKGQGALPKSMGDSIICTMTLIQQRAARVKALGSAAICYSWDNRLFLMPHLGYFLTGLGLWVGGLVMIIAVPFLMVDSVIQLAVAGALLPMAIGAYAFNSTRKYTKKVWETFLNSMFAFLFMSLIVLMLATAFEQIVVDSTSSMDDLLSWTGGDLTKILKDIPWFSSAFLKVCFVLILLWTVMSEAKSFAGNFSGSISNTNIGSQIGTMGGSFAKGTLNKATKLPREAAGKALLHGAGTLLKGGVGLARTAATEIQTSHVKRKGVQNGNTFTYTKGNKTFVLTENADGTHTLAKNSVKANRAWIPGRVQADGKRHWGFGAKIGEKEITKVKSNNFSTTSTTYRDKNGNIVGIKDSTVRNSLKGANAFDHEGRVKAGALNILNIPADTEGRDKIAIAGVKDLISQRMPNIDIDKKLYTQQRAIYDSQGQCTGYEQINADGSRIIVNLVTGENGRLTTELTTIDAKGRGTRLSSNGIINTKKTFRTQDGTANGKIDENSIKESYGVAAEYQRYYRQGRYHKIPWNELVELVGPEEAERIQKYVRGNHQIRDAEMYEFRTAEQI